jgi:hypothetical protein
MTIELYEGEMPGVGFYFTEQNIIVNALGWNTVNFAPNFQLNAGQVYHVVLRPTVESSNFIGILQSNVTPPGEHSGGTLFAYNPGTGGFDAFAVDDMDFRIKSLVNNKAWVDLH